MQRPPQVSGATVGNTLLQNSQVDEGEWRGRRERERNLNEILTTVFSPRQAPLQALHRTHSLLSHRPHLYECDSAVHGVLGLGLAGREELAVSCTEDHHVEETLVRNVVEEEEENLLGTRQ